MADDNNNQNQNQNKQKGGGGGGGVSGIQYGGKLDPAQMRSEESLGQLITDQLIVAGTVVASTALMYLLTKKVRSIFGVEASKPGAAQQQNGPLNAGQIIGGLHHLRKTDPAKLADIGAKNPEILRLMTPAVIPASEEKPVIDVEPF